MLELQSQSFLAIPKSKISSFKSFNKQCVYFAITCAFCKHVGKNMSWKYMKKKIQKKKPSNIHFQETIK